MAFIDIDDDEAIEASIGEHLSKMSDKALTNLASFFGITSGYDKYDPEQSEQINKIGSDFLKDKVSAMEASKALKSLGLSPSTAAKFLNRWREEKSWRAGDGKKQDLPVRSGNDFETIGRYDIGKFKAMTDDELQEYISYCKERSSKYNTLSPHFARYSDMWAAAEKVLRSRQVQSGRDFATDIAKQRAEQVVVSSVLPKKRKGPFDLQ